MGTRSTISLKTGKTVRTIYCHWDGYPSFNGQILLDHYQKRKKISELIKLGDLSSLGQHVKPEDAGTGTVHVWKDGKYVEVPATEPHSYENKWHGVTCAYHRDRGEDLSEARLYQGTPYEGEAYDYMFKDGKWFVKNCYVQEETWVELTQELIDNEEAYLTSG